MDEAALTLSTLVHTERLQAANMTLPADEEAAEQTGAAGAADTAGAGAAAEGSNAAELSNAALAPDVAGTAYNNMHAALPAASLSAQGSEDVETAGASEAPALAAPVDSAGTLAYLLIHCASCRVANEVPVAASEKAREFTVQCHTCREYSALTIDTSGEPLVVAEGLSEWSRPPPEPPPASALVPPKKRKKDVPRPADKAAENEESEDDVEDAPEAEGRDGDDEDDEDEEDEPLSKRASASGLVAPAGACGDVAVSTRNRPVASASSAVAHLDCSTHRLRLAPRPGTCRGSRFAGEFARVSFRTGRS